jgi:hypothetical protein
MALEITYATAQRLVQSDRRLLAPRMEEQVRDFEQRCALSKQPIRVYETARTHQLARMYYQLGASKARDGWRTWHFYGAAVDLIHPTRAWAAWDSPDQPDVDWRETVIEHGKAIGLQWGGDWKSFKDYAHWQFGTVKPSPSDEAIRLYRDEGIVQLWKVIGAL